MSQIEVELLETMGSDRAIADSAWTSSSDISKKALKGQEDIERVVNMLADSKHSVPFESVVMRFWISMPISSDRQHMTHRIASHSGMSGRYRTMPTEFFDVPGDILTILDKIYETKSLEYTDAYNDLCEKTNSFYLKQVKAAKEAQRTGLITNDEFKRIREFTRNVLPQGNMTERVTVINLRSFCNFYKLRSKADAQVEIRQIAELMMQKLKESNICPVALTALEKNSWTI